MSGRVRVKQTFRYAGLRAVMSGSKEVGRIISEYKIFQNVNRTIKTISPEITGGQSLLS